MTVKWVFADYWETGPTPYQYVWEINPNEGGSPQVTKNISMASNTGPNRVAIVQEGSNQAATLTFSGIILTQEHYEAIEYWYDRRVLIKLTDDLGRQFFGIFSKFAPQRSRRSTNPWYHTYSAEFVVSAYINASGQRVYGKVD